MKQSGIYEITCTANGKAYYGSTTHWRNRRQAHRAALRRGDHPNEHLQRAWNKYGADAFRFDFLLAVFPEYLFFVEQMHIDSNADGFNIAVDARVASRGRKRKPCSEATRQKLRVANSGKRQTAESNAKRSAAIKALPRDVIYRRALAQTLSSKCYFWKPKRRRYLVRVRGIYGGMFRTEAEAKTAADAIKAKLPLNAPLDTPGRQSQTD